MNDCCEYKILSADPKQFDLIKQFVENNTKDYIWQKEPFSLSKQIKEIENDQSQYLRGRTKSDLPNLTTQLWRQ